MRTKFEASSESIYAVHSLEAIQWSIDPIVAEGALSLRYAVLARYVASRRAACAYQRQCAWTQLDRVREALGTAESLESIELPGISEACGVEPMESHGARDAHESGGARGWRRGVAVYEI